MSVRKQEKITLANSFLTDRHLVQVVFLKMRSVNTLSYPSVKVWRFIACIYTTATFTGYCKNSVIGCILPSCCSQSFCAAVSGLGTRLPSPEGNHMIVIKIGMTCFWVWVSIILLLTGCVLVQGQLLDTTFLGSVSGSISSKNTNTLDYLHLVFISVSVSLRISSRKCFS